MVTTNQKPTVTELDFEDTQGLVLNTYKHLATSVNLFLKIGDVTQAREWLKIMRPQVMSAARWPIGPDGKTIKPETALNLAFTADGLALLNIPLAGFSTEFREGMAPRNPDKPEDLCARSRRLGDTGPSHPATWEYGGLKNETIHIYLLLFAADNDRLKEYLQNQRDNWERYGLTQIAEEFTYRPGHSREPFGFRDGMSQPGISGLDTKDEELGSDKEIIAAGEFVQGYLNEYGYYPPVPDKSELAKNGTYIVYRKLEQDVMTFWNFVYSTAGNDPTKAEYLAAKFVGRWRDGTPLTFSPNHNDPKLAADAGRNNNFQFVADNDKPGYGCPVGSHVRRTNPRDSLMPDPTASTTAVRRHRIVRRGRVYGPEYPEDVVAHLTQIKAAQGADKFVADSDKPRGLIFMCINTDIKRQFEFIQQTWVNDPKFDGLYQDKDPLMGSNEDDEVSNMTIQAKPIRQQIKNLPRFVTVRAGGYFYLPGIAGLRYIAELT